MENHKEYYEKLYQDYQEKLSSITDGELIERFNGQVGNGGWGTARMLYLTVIGEQFKEREIDISEIQGNGGISYKNKVKLKNKKVYIIENN